MARAWHLKSRPHGMPTPDNFELKEVACRRSATAWSACATSGCRSIPTCAAG